MKIEQVECIPLRYPTKGRFKFFEDEKGRPTGRAAVLVIIRTDNGLEGYGMSVPLPSWSYETLETVITTIKNYLAPALRGKEVFDLVHIHQIMNRIIAPSFSTGQPICKAAIDLAIHDIIGKAHQKCIQDLWGKSQYMPVVLSYTLNPRSVDDVDKMIEEGRKLGYRHFNVKVAPNLEYDIALCKRVRELVPEGFLWADANGNYDLPTAEEAVRRFADIGVNVLEQPLPANYLSGYKQLKKIGAVPILMDEGIVSSRELQEFIALGLLDGIAIKPARCGGLLEARSQIQICKEEGLLVLGSGLTDPDVSLAASVHLFSFYQISYPAALNGPQYLDFSILETELLPAEGKLLPPKGPGLGIKIDWSKVEKIKAELIF